MNFIIKTIVTWVLSYVLIFGASILIPQIQLGGFIPFAIFLIILLLINKILNPILQLFGFPLTVLTLGLFSVVINFFCLYLAIQSSSGAIVVNATGLGWLICMFVISGLLSLANNIQLGSDSGE